MYLALFFDKVMRDNEFGTSSRTIKVNNTTKERRGKGTKGGRGEGTTEGRRDDEGTKGRRRVDEGTTKGRRDDEGKKE